jgi:hypothetical protein
MKLNQAFGLPPVLWAKTPSAQHENHRVLSLQRRKLAAFPGVI